MKEYIATFYSHYGAVCFKKNCEKAGISAMIMPVPRNLSSSCGTCVRFRTREELSSSTLPEINEELEQIVRILEKGYEELYRSEE